MNQQLYQKARQTGDMCAVGRERLEGLVSPGDVELGEHLDPGPLQRG